MYINAYNHALYNATMEQILLFSALRFVNSQFFSLMAIGTTSSFNFAQIKKLTDNFKELPDKNRGRVDRFLNFYRLHIYVWPTVY